MTAPIGTVKKQWNVADKEKDMALERDGNIIWSDKSGAEEQLTEILEARQAQEEVAYHWISDEQWALADGRKHHFMIPHPYGEQTLMIYGWTWDWEYDKEKWKDLPPGEERRESEYEYETYMDSLKRGYAFTRSFSVIEPVGELGSHHISTMVPLTEEQFNNAEANAWVPNYVDTILLLEFKERYTAFMKAKEKK